MLVKSAAKYLSRSCQGGSNIFQEILFRVGLCDGCEFQVILAVGQLRWLCFFDHFCFLIMISVSFDVPCLLHVPIKLWRWLIVLMSTRYILTMQCGWLGRWSRGGSSSGARELLELRWLIHLYSVYIKIYGLLTLLLNHLPTTFLLYSNHLLATFLKLNAVKWGEIM